MNIRYSMLPKANPLDDYYEELNETIDDETRLIGKVLNKTDDNMLIKVVVSDSIIRQSCHRAMFFEVNERQYLNGCRIIMSSDHEKNIRNNPFLFSFIWHEVGHFHTIPYILDVSKLSVPDQRFLYAIEGNVMPDEKVADLFAAYMMGKDNLIKAMKLCREERKKTLPNNPTTELAAKEYTNRIRFIKEIEDEKVLDKFYEEFEANKIK